MRIDNSLFHNKNKSVVKESRYVLKINFDPDQPTSGINKWIGSHDDIDFPENVLSSEETYTVKQIQELLATTPEANDYHGGSCDFSDDGSVLITTATAFDTVDYRSGKLMIWDRAGDDTYSLNTTFAPSDLSIDDHFPYMAWISGDGSTIIASSPKEASSASDAGAVYVIKKVADVWTEVKRCEMATPVANSQFGWKGAISYDGFSFLATAPFDPNGGTSRGTAWVLETDDDWSTYTREEIISPAETDNYNFGYGATMSGNALRLAIAENYTTVNKSGRLRVYTRPDKNTPWSYIHLVTAFDGEAGDHFGINESGNPTLFSGSGLVMNFDGSILAVGDRDWETL